jgi:uncharacterized coiled-coil DUF342 family protein
MTPDPLDAMQGRQKFPVDPNSPGAPKSALEKLHEAVATLRSQLDTLRVQFAAQCHAVESLRRERNQLLHEMKKRGFTVTEIRGVFTIEDPPA